MTYSRRLRVHRDFPPAIFHLYLEVRESKKQVIFGNIVPKSLLEQVDVEVQFLVVG